jgi:hypothetical protein
VPPLDRRAALMRIPSLDCSVPTFQSCDYLPPPVGTGWWRTTQRDAGAWRKALEEARVDDETFQKALANTLKELVCSAADNAIYVVRGEGFQIRLKAARSAAYDLIGDFTNKDSKDCPVAAALTDADRAKLLQIKQEVIDQCERRTGVFRRSRVFERCVGAEKGGKKTAP